MLAAIPRENEREKGSRLARPIRARRKALIVSRIVYHTVRMRRKSEYCVALRRCGKLKQGKRFPLYRRNANPSPHPYLSHVTTKAQKQRVWPAGSICSRIASAGTLRDMSTDEPQSDVARNSRQRSKPVPLTPPRCIDRPCRI